MSAGASDGRLPHGRIEYGFDVARIASSGALVTVSLPSSVLIRWAKCTVSGVSPAYCEACPVSLRYGTTLGPSPSSNPGALFLLTTRKYTFRVVDVVALTSECPASWARSGNRARAALPRAT